MMCMAAQRLRSAQHRSGRKAAGRGENKTVGRARQTKTELKKNLIRFRNPSWRA
ncbi:hypothetical protein BGY98DRAFT_1053798 [Russula aff. rugulosa BPL654]|nr:hypothetical protein BGY98DRAFT_1053798 [Russula aff. rugulosa BPL654]